MRQTLFFLITFLISQISLSAQCTPIDCSASLPVYGGICEDTFNDGMVNEDYEDFESFVITGECFDAGLIDPANAGVDIVILNVSNFSFTGLPAGLTAVTDQDMYSSMTGSITLGCMNVDGVPTEAGLFEVNAVFDAEVDAYLFGGCPGGFSITQSAESNYALQLLILPDPTFTGLEDEYCESHDDVTLVATGTPGGTFSGPGVSGNTFSPMAAGPGIHEITYEVSAQEGSATGPASNASSMEVFVEQADVYYADSDGDGYGDEDDFVLVCGDEPDGYSFDFGDCDDNDANVNPDADEVCNGYDDNCDGDIDEGFDEDNDGVTVCDGDCNDNDPNIHEGITEICNGIDDNCDGVIDEGYDMDNDGFTVCDGDCDDTNPAINAGATDLCDGIDYNCDGEVVQNVMTLVEIDICIGDTVIINGQAVSVPGVYEEVLIAGSGCDSIVETIVAHIGIEPAYISSIEDLVCVTADPMDLTEDVSPAGGVFSGTGIDGNFFNPELAGVGTHTITYTVEFGDCMYETSINITVEMCTSTEDLGNSLVTLFPNPTSDILYFSIDEGRWNNDISVKIYNAELRQIYGSTFMINDWSDETLHLDMSNLDPGIYVISIQMDTEHIVRRIHRM